LRRFGRHGEDSDLGSRFAHDIGQLFGGTDQESADFAADLARIVVDRGDDVEGAVVEA